MKKRILAFAILTLLHGTIALAAEVKPVPAEGESFLDKYPLLKKNLYNEPNSNLYLGFSVGILGIVHDRMYFSANFFQLHYMSSYWDSEILSVSYGTTTANPSYVQSNHFVFRTMPMYRLTRFWSFGVVGGYEYVSFPQISTVIFDGIYQTKTEPFSTSGVIYGFAASQNFESESNYKFKLTESVYKESYSTENAGHGWKYLYDSTALRKDTTPIKAGVVMLVEAGFVF
ncbi:MAG: hypothetical protein ACXVB1_09850 [Pseudobdellovibrionaceae bacterium]